MRQNNGERVYGPYPNRNSWRIVLVGSGNSREAFTFSSEAEARRHKDELLRQIEGRSVSDAAQTYLVGLRERGLRHATVVRQETHLRSFFQLDVTEEGERRIPFGKTGGKLDDLSRKRCEQLYAELRTHVEVETHRTSLVAAKAFGAWCVEQGWLRDNPAEPIKPLGERNRGKKQLRIDEARKLVDLCLAKANDGHVGAIATLTALMLGLRASEVTDRVCRDLDDDGRLLWVPFGKTNASKRALDVPEMLRPYLLRLTEGRGPEDQLVGIAAGRVERERPADEKGPRDRFWLLRQVHILCDKAKIPIVCSHSLRGLHATLATEAGATPHLVAAALGHRSIQVAERHYTDRGAADRAKTRKVMGRLARHEATHSSTASGASEAGKGEQPTRSP